MVARAALWEVRVAHGREMLRWVADSEGGQMASGVCEVDAQGMQLFSHDSGENTLVIVVEAVMDHDVDAGALSEAVRRAELRFDAFGCGLASSGLGLVYRRLTTSACAYEDVGGAGDGGSGRTRRTAGSTA